MTCDQPGPFLECSAPGLPNHCPSLPAGLLNHLNHLPFGRASLPATCCGQRSRTTGSGQSPPTNCADHWARGLETRQAGPSVFSAGRQLPRVQRRDHAPRTLTSPFYHLYLRRLSTHCIFNLHSRMTVPQSLTVLF